MSQGMKDYDAHRQTATVEVYDLKNPERLLGFLTQRPMSEVAGASYRVAVLRREAMIYAPSDVVPVSLPYREVRFRFGRREREGGWITATVFETDAPLEDLMVIRDFRLPGETGRQADIRHRVSR